MSQPQIVIDPDEVCGIEQNLILREILSPDWVLNP